MIALPSFVVDALSRHKGLQAEQRLALGEIYRNHGLVVAQDNGRPWAPKIISKAFEHLASRAGVPEIRFHDLRHSHATQLLKHKIHAKVVSERLGHARISTTLDIYSHVLPGMQEEAAQRVDDAMRAAITSQKRRA